MSKLDIKRTIQLAGNQHRYQKILVFLLSLMWIQMNFILIGPTLIYMDPVFNCFSTGDSRASQKQACKMINQCKLMYQFTVTAKLQLYCGKQALRDIIQSILALGSFIGLIIINPISDTVGRKISVAICLISCISGIIFAFIGSIIQQVSLILIGQFLCGFGAYALVTISYALISDFCSDQFRPRAVVVVNSAWGTATFALGLFYYYEIDWYTFLLYIMLIPFSITSLLIYKYIKQSPYILIYQNKKQLALKILIQLAEINKKITNIGQIKQIIKNLDDKSRQDKISLKKVCTTIKKWKYFKPILILTIIYGVGNINLYGISYSLGTQGEGFGINNIVSGFAETITFFNLSNDFQLSSDFVINYIPRKKGISCFYFLVMMIGLTFIIPQVQKDYILSTILIGVSRVFSSIAYTLIACMQTEAFTIQIQSTSSGIIQAFSLYGVLIAPLLVDFADKIGINPITLISLCVIFAILPPIFMKQTLNLDVKQDKQLVILIKKKQSLDATLQQFNQDNLN